MPIFLFSFSFSYDKIFCKGDIMESLSNLNLSQKKYMVFDMDGTLIDSIGIWNEADYKIIDKYAGVNMDLDLLQKDRENFLEHNSDSDIYIAYCEYLIQKYGMNISKEQLIQERWASVDFILRNELTYKLGVSELLNLLKSKGFVVALATATTQRQLDIYSEGNKSMACAVPFYDTFDYVVRKEDVVHKKPHPEVYMRILEHYHVNPQQCLVFEDSLHGVMAAKAAGIEVVNVYDKYSDKDRNEINSLANYKIDSYCEFIDFLKEGKGYEYKKRKY